MLGINMNDVITTIGLLKNQLILIGVLLALAIIITSGFCSDHQPDPDWPDVQHGQHGLQKGRRHQ